MKNKPEQKPVPKKQSKEENINYHLKISTKNKLQLQETYGREMEKVDLRIVKEEENLNRILEEINEKENQIYEVQKIKLEGFKNEVEKFDRIKNIIEDHLKRLSSDIYTSKFNAKQRSNQTYMIYEDYLSNNHEACLSKNRILDLKNTLSQIEKTYPKDFEFLFEDIQLERELLEKENTKKMIVKEMKDLERMKVKLFHDKSDKEERKELVDVEFKKIDEQIEESYKDSHLKNVEEYLVKHVSNLLDFPNLQSLIQGFYSQKNFDVENEINVILMKNLANKLTQMKNEFYQIKNEKENQLLKISEEVERIKSQIENENEKEGKVKKTSKKTKKQIKAGSQGVNSILNNQFYMEEQIKIKKEEGERLHNEISKLELNCKKKETLFNKYLILLRNKCTKSEEESYYKANPCLIIDNNFEELFKNEMINSLRERRDDITDEEIKKHEGTIDIYFKDLFERERTIQLILLQRTKIEAEVNEHEKAINQLSDKILETENQMKLKKMRLSEINQSINLLHSRIETRNRTLKMSLEALSESNFMEYLNSNEEVLKSMKKIYGNKILSKVFKAQKEKFYENVMLDHTFKKQKINEFVTLVNKYEETINKYDENMNVLLEKFKSSSYILDETREYLEVKQLEERSLLEAKSDLIENLNKMLVEEMNEITNEKIKLRQKLNCDFYYVKVKEISKKIEGLKKEKQRVLNEFYSFRNVIVDKEDRLLREDFKYKSNIIDCDNENLFSDIISSKFIKSEYDDRPSSPLPFKVNSNTLNQICERENDLDVIINQIVSEKGENHEQREEQKINVNKKDDVEEIENFPLDDQQTETYNNDEKQRDTNRHASSNRLETSSKYLYIKQLFSLLLQLTYTNIK